VAGPRRLRGPRAVSTRALGTTALALTALAIMAYGAQSLTRVWQIRHEVQSLEREIVGLRAETAALQATVAQLRSDPDAIEKLARELLGFVKPGERVLKLPPSSGGQ
jgi:cell division protein FtsB